MSYESRILADSVGPHGVRLTTFEATFPRILLSEVNTHRMLSRNSASSRAIPTEKQIEKVRANPFVPTFAGRVKGMGVGEALSEDEQQHVQGIWLGQAEAACRAAEQLLHVDKSRANRLLEPFSWHKAIISGTEWLNFFNLRDHEGAQPEMQTIARMMREDYESHRPEKLDPGEWHLPLIDEQDFMDAYAEDWMARDIATASAGRCAKVSYDRHNEPEDIFTSADRWDRLYPAAHWSPGEHPAECLEEPTRVNNYIGFKQLRAFYPNEAIFTG